MKYITTLGIICFFALACFGQENTASLCGDGIDNDGDGLIDCMDPDCNALPNNGCATCTDGISFADSLIAYNPGCFLGDPNPEGALGVSDWRGSNLDERGVVFLGQGGSIKLGFTNNLLTSSGTPDPDLWIFEVGEAAEPSQIALKPADAFTQTQLVAAGLVDADNDGYYEFGNIAGASTRLDIDAFVPGFPEGDLLFDAVEITDIDDGNCFSLTPGADIDAICALSQVIVDCNGRPNGTAVLDSCGICLEPNDPNFNQVCIDCNGTPNGTAVLDSCGVCLEPNDPNFNQTCIDCNGTPNGTAILDSCGVCLEPNDPNFNQACIDCNGTPNGTAILDSCCVCLEPNDPNFNQDCIDCNGTPKGTAVLDSCGVCLEPNDPNFNQTCIDCNGTPNGTAVLDSCGVCLEPNDPNFNQACIDCNGTPKGTAVLDSCGVCLRPNDPNFNQACIDCNGTPNGTAILDSCGVCLEPNDPIFNQTCIDCNGTPNGTAVLDSCGVCLEPNDPNFNQTCIDCNGTPNGTAILDSCGVCLEPNDPNFNQTCIDCNGTPNGTAILDSCGVCLEPNDPNFNQSCQKNNAVYIPNAFSPNGDGSNDLFQVFMDANISARINRYYIYDSWGGLVYERQDLDFNSSMDWWDGRSGGQDLAPGIFAYFIEIEFQDGDKKQFTGAIVLIR